MVATDKCGFNIGMYMLIHLFQQIIHLSTPKDINIHKYNCIRVWNNYLYKQMNHLKYSRTLDSQYKILSKQNCYKLTEYIVVCTLIALYNLHNLTYTRHHCFLQSTRLRICMHSILPQIANMLTYFISIILTFSHKYLLNTLLHNFHFQ